MREINLENVGPVEHLMIPLPDAGVVVLRGRNGVGKSHALEAVEAAVSKRGRPPVRDHAKKGKVEGVGVRLTIGRSMRRTGEAEVQTLEGKLDITQLVDPGLKDESAANRVRVKALLQLAGAAGEAKEFEPIVPPGYDLEELLPIAARHGDLVSMAARLKRELEAAARQHETAARDFKAQAVAVKERLPEEIGSGPSPKEAEQELSNALLARRELEVKRQQAEKRAAQAEEAARRLDSLKQTSKAAVDIRQRVVESRERIAQLEASLKAERARLVELESDLHAAEQAEREMAELEQVLGDIPEGPTDAELAAATERVERAKREHELAISREEARHNLEVADKLLSAADDRLRQAEMLRGSAKATDSILSDWVAKVTSKLRVEDGVLVCDTDRGAEPFAELSPGERWRIALEIAATQVGKGGLVAVPQEAWESLDPVNRKEVAEVAKSTGVVILTAEASDDEQIVCDLL